MCSGNARDSSKTFIVKGDPRRTYSMTLRIRGVTEAKNYTGGKRRVARGMDASPTGGDMWYEGGTVPFSDYNSYELYVTPPVAGGPNDYYLNSRDASGEGDHLSWGLNYMATIKIKGGGSIEFRTYDSNCRQIMNCGPTAGNVCRSPRVIDVRGSMPPPPASFMQPPRSSQNATGQWVFFDVSDVQAL
jgi:hypothetical protein